MANTQGSPPQTTPETGTGLRTTERQADEGLTTYDEEVAFLR
jgi:hypothetical protein